jgi:hypothetical protein
VTPPNPAPVKLRAGGYPHDVYKMDLIYIHVRKKVYARKYLMLGGTIWIDRTASAHPRTGSRTSLRTATAPRLL